MAEDTNLKFGKHAPRNRPDMAPEFFGKGGAGWPGSCDTLNLWQLNTNRSRTTKVTDLKFGLHAPDI